jgi:siroheme decarboxylase
MNGPDTPPNLSLDEADRRLVLATQAGLPLVSRPFEALGAELGLSSDEVRRRLADLLARGVIRRIGAVPNHYALGYVANGMSVWDVDDSRLEELGAAVGRLPFVTHCYQRPRHLPLWPYNLFAMVHGRSRSEVRERLAEIATVLGHACRAQDVLFSTRILKKSGLRIGA